MKLILRTWILSMKLLESCLRFYARQVGIFLFLKCSMHLKLLTKSSQQATKSKILLIKHKIQAKKMEMNSEKRYKKLTFQFARCTKKKKMKSQIFLRLNLSIFLLMRLRNFDIQDSYQALVKTLLSLKRTSLEKLVWSR